MRRGSPSSFRRRGRRPRRRRRVGPDALAARTGGDEFVAVLGPSQRPPEVTSLTVPVPSGVVVRVSPGDVG